MYFTHPQFKKINLGLFFKKVSEAGLRKKLAKFFPNRYIIFTDLGRSAFQLAIKELGLESSEMLVPAYICDIFLPIFRHYNIKPIYLDIDLKTFNTKIEEIERKITPKVKSILICHTYGLPNEMDKILEITKRYNLKIIENCAHSFGVKFKDQCLGNFGDCAFFSLSKFLPSINGGIFISKTKPKSLLLNKFSSKKLANLIKFLRLFPSLASFSEKFRKKDITLTTKDFSIPQKASKGSLKALNNYLNNDLNNYLNKRTKLAKYFQKKLNELRFQSSPGFTYISALVPKNINRDKLFNKLRKHNIFCSRIWHRPIYKNLPNTSEAAKRIINFPLQNWFTKKDIDKIINDILLEMGLVF